MGNYDDHINGKTLAPGASTSFTTQTSLKETLRVQIVGDSDSTDLDITTAGKTSPNAAFGQDAFNDETSKNLTKELNNSDIFKVDVQGINSLKVTIKNNSNTGTTIDAYEGFVTER